MVLFGLRDVGSVIACSPAIEVFKDKGIPTMIYAEGPSRERLKGKFSFVSDCLIGDLFDSVRPSLVVATCATKGGAIPIILTTEAKLRNIPVVLVEDMWAGHSAFVWNVLPDGICVTDEFSKSLVVKSWTGYSESRIHITGAPVFDKFIGISTEPARYNLRKLLRLNEGWPVVFFPGTGLIAGMTQVIRMLVEALNKLAAPVYLILRDHPSVAFCDISGYRDELKNLKIGQVIDSSKLTSNEVNAGSDIVVGTFSTMTVEACYMRKPVLIISIPETKKILAEATNNTLTEWPLVNLGASLKAENIEETKACLRKIIEGDIATMFQAQQKHFKTDGLSGQRVAESILGYYC